MQMGMIRPERMGENMGRRGMQAGQDCVIFDLDANFVRALQMEAAVGMPRSWKTCLGSSKHHALSGLWCPQGLSIKP